MKNILFCFIIIPCLLSCQSKQPSYEMYQEVIQTVIEADSLDKISNLNNNVEKYKHFKRKANQIGEYESPDFDEIEISYLLDGFNSTQRKQDSLFLLNQINKECYYKIDDKICSQFNYSSENLYTFSDLLFSKDLKNVFCNYSYFCGTFCSKESRLFLKKNNGKWEIIYKVVDEF